MKSLKQINSFILDTLFPISCLNCNKDGIWLCPECLNKIKLLPEQVCPYCEKNITDAGRVCPACKNKFLDKNAVIPLDNLIVASSYKENNISSLVHLYKYNFIRDLSVPLGKLLIKTILKNNLPLPDLIIPVPLHKKRLRWRGFNQSELLANYIGENITPGFPIPVLSDFIIRKKYTRPQMKIKNYKERQKNIEGIFSVGNNNYCSLQDDVARKTILLVDDIATTGSTLFECGKILKKYGAKKVFGLVIARQEVSP